MQPTSSHLSPSTTLAGLTVSDTMHPGMVSCPAETSLRTVARMMTTYRVHAIFVHERGAEPGTAQSWGVVTDGEILVAALADELDVEARRVAAAPVLVVTPTEPLGRAMQLMRDHEVTHLVVVEAVSGRPLGVLSTLDVARAVAGRDVVA